MSSPTAVQDCVAWWVANLNLITEFGGRVVQSYSDTDLMTQMKIAPRPCVGVMYESIVSVSEDGVKDSNKIGRSGILSISLIVMVDGKMAGVERGFNPAIALLDKIRDQNKTLTSPTGHKWRFIAEGPATEKSGIVVWLQRWSTPVQLV